MVRSMAREADRLRHGQPDPEISYEDAMAARGRRHHGHRPQRLPEPGQQRARLPVHLPRRARRAGDGHQRRDEAGRRHALAELAREDVPDSVLKAYGADHLQFGREYLIPKPFDYRVLLWVPPAVAKAAMETGVARGRSRTSRPTSGGSRRSSRAASS
jgi:malate dehydrogenase (oxaloacetate-decarboxylating)(NADP+)